MLFNHSKNLLDWKMKLSQPKRPTTEKTNGQKSEQIRDALTSEIIVSLLRDTFTA